MQQKNIFHITVGDIATNCWIYPLDEVPFCAVIDPGGDPARIITRLNELKLAPRYILLTHGHFDHIAALPALAAAYREKSGPLIAIHSGDSLCLGPESYEVHCQVSMWASGDTAWVDALWETMPAADKLLAEGDTIGPFTVLHVPGHTRGSAAFWDKEAKILFSGDTLFRGDYGRTDLPGGSGEQIFASLKRLLALDGAIRVLPGHGLATSIAGEQGLVLS